MGGCVSGLKDEHHITKCPTKGSRQVLKRLWYTNKSANRSERMKFIDPRESESTGERKLSQGILNRLFLVELFLHEFFHFSAIMWLVA